MAKLSLDGEKAAHRRFEQVMEDHFGWSHLDLRMDRYYRYENKDIELMWTGFKASLEHNPTNGAIVLGYVRVQKDTKTGVSITSFSTVQEPGHLPVVLDPNSIQLDLL